MIAFVFPGQGSQSVGMGTGILAASAAASRVLAEASDAAGIDLASLDESALSQTRYAQMAIVAHSLAAHAALLEHMPSLRTTDPATLAFAGFSLGEYTALCASGRLSLANTMRLVTKRSELMQEASDANPGAMAAVLGLKDEAVIAVLDQPDFRGKVFAVNYNAPGQLVIAGEAAAMAACVEALKSAGARRVVPLAVSGAFHTRLMASAASPLAEFARTLPYHSSSHPLYSNRSGQLIPDSVDLPSHLAEHLCSPVLWTRTVLNMKTDGFTHFVECGPGKVLSGLIRKIDATLSVSPVDDEKTLRNVVETLKV